MNNANLVNALREAATARGLSFRTADGDRIATPAPHLPAALLTPPKLNTVDGRRHGRAEYDISLRLLDDAARLPEQQRAECRHRLEKLALEIFAALSDEEFVIAVRKLAIVPRPFSEMGVGEMSAVASARVITCF